MVGRVRTCKLGPSGLEEEAAWIERYRQRWVARFDELEKLVEELKQKEKADGGKRAVPSFRVACATTRAFNFSPTLALARKY
jgi:hypothetical protein